MLVESALIKQVHSNAFDDGLRTYFRIISKLNKSPDDIGQIKQALRLLLSRTFLDKIPKN